jgi:hypothetical protein
MISALDLWGSAGGSALLRVDTVAEGSMLADSETSLLMVSGAGSTSSRRERFFLNAPSGAPNELGSGSSLIPEGTSVMPDSVQTLTKGQG